MKASDGAQLVRRARATFALIRDMEQREQLRSWVHATFADDPHSPAQVSNIVQTMQSLHDSDPLFWADYTFDYLYECAFPRARC